MAKRPAGVAAFEGELHPRDEQVGRDGAFGDHETQHLPVLVVQKDRAAIERHDGAERVGDGLEQRIARQVEDDRIVDGQQRSGALRRLHQLLVERGDLIGRSQPLQLDGGSGRKRSEEQRSRLVRFHRLDVEHREVPQDLARTCR